MPLERPRRTPVLTRDGQNDPKWLQYFDNLDTTTTVTEDFETQTRFLGDPFPDTGNTRRLKAANAVNEANIAAAQVAITANQVAITDLTDRVTTLEFLSV